MSTPIHSGSGTAGRRPGRRRVPWALIMLAALVIVPIVEIFVIVQVGQAIGAWWTILLLVVESLIGGWLLKREGSRTWRRVRETFNRGAMPDRELADAALILIGGTLLLTPGFVTDVFGFFAILPPTRPIARRVLMWAVERRIGTLGVAGSGVGPLGGFPGGLGGAFGRGGRDGRDDRDPYDAARPDGSVVDGRVVRPEDRRTG